MDMNRKYRVAGHEFELSFPERIDHAHLLDSYEPFRIEGCSDPAFALEVGIGELPYPGEMKERFNDEAPYTWLYLREDGGFNFGFSFSPESTSSVLEFHGRRAVLTIAEGAPKREADTCIGNAMMLLYAYNTVADQTLMIHASVSVKDGLGYLFLGKSGTGKSTHSRLWKESMPDVWLLNDDNPVLRVIDGKTYVYGTPWSGKVPCYRNESVPVEGIVRLAQAPHNHFERLEDIRAFVEIYKGCSVLRADVGLHDLLCDNLTAVIDSVAVGHLDCLPDEDAARLCYRNLTEE